MLGVAQDLGAGRAGKAHGLGKPVARFGSDVLQGYLFSQALGLEGRKAVKADWLKDHDRVWKHLAWQAKGLTMADRDMQTSQARFQTWWWPCAVKQLHC